MSDIDEMAAEIVRLHKDREWRDISTLEEPRQSDRATVYLALDDAAHPAVVIAEAAAWQNGDEGFSGYCGWDGDIFETDGNGWHCTRYRVSHGVPTGDGYRVNVVAWMDALLPLPPPPEKEKT